MNVTVLTILFHLVSTPDDVKQMQFYWPNEGQSGVAWCEAVSEHLHETTTDNIIIVSTECEDK